MFYLECLAPLTGARFALRRGVNVLGRAAGCEVQVEDQSLSRRHVELRADGAMLVLRDLGSRNGTRLNGVRLAGEARAVAGDRIQCGDVVLVLRELTRGDPMAPSPPVPRALAPSQTVSLKPREEVDPAARRLATLLRVAELLARAGAGTRVPERILELAAEILPVGRALLLTVGEDGELTVRASKLDGPVEGRPYSESIVRLVLEERMAAQFDDAGADERLGAASSVMAQSIRCAMCAPLLLDDRVLGAIYVDNQLSAHSFGPSDLELLAGFANQAALALDNAALQARLRQVALRQNTLERFFPPATVTKLLDSGGDLGVSEMFVTTLFSDISGFTAMSATTPPAEIVALLHRYFPPMARIVFSKEGTLEKYIGDALMAVWGAPFGHPDDADRALEAAVEMHQTVERMRETLPRPIQIHIGLHSGTVALANIGSSEYLQVATIGDATNTSARVCGVAGEGELLITRATADRLTRPSFALTALPPTTVKGKREPLELFRVEWRRG